MLLFLTTSNRQCDRRVTWNFSSSFFRLHVFRFRKTTANAERQIMSTVIRTVPYGRGTHVRIACEQTRNYKKTQLVSKFIDTKKLERFFSLNVR